jgi:hypothetical protein
MLLEVELHPLRYKVEEVPSLQHLPSTLTSPLSLFSILFLQGFVLELLFSCVFIFGANTSIYSA